MTGGLPGLAGSDHVGFTVPDIENATRFFVDVIGCEVAFEIGPLSLTMIGWRCIWACIPAP